MRPSQEIKVYMPSGAKEKGLVVWNFKEKEDNAQEGEKE